MSKRKLTHQQARRAQGQQARRRARADTQPGAAPDQLDQAALGPEQEGLVVANYGPSVAVKNSQGEIYRCQLRQNLEELVCGDRVVWQPAAQGSGVVVALMPRQSLLCRPGFHGRRKIIAANIDQILVTAAPRPELNTRLIDRYLIAAEHTGITPVIVINKIDLLNEAEFAAIRAQLAIYAQIGYQVLFASAVSQHGLDDLVQRLASKTSIFVGHSGVGKSSLLKALLPGREVRIGEMSAATGRGTHTTTVAELYPLPAGGGLIDSPGIREFGLWDIEPGEIAQGFVEFRPYLGTCRFRDCRHRDEPGCAILEATQAGKISEQRLTSYWRILESAAEDQV